MTKKFYHLMGLSHLPSFHSQKRQEKIEEREGRWLFSLLLLLLTLSLSLGLSSMETVGVREFNYFIIVPPMARHHLQENPPLLHLQWQLPKRQKSDSLIEGEKGKERGHGSYPLLHWPCPGPPPTTTPSSSPAPAVTSPSLPSPVPVFHLARVNPAMVIVLATTAIRHHWLPPHASSPRPSAGSCHNRRPSSPVMIFNGWSSHDVVANELHCHHWHRRPLHQMGLRRHSPPSSLTPIVIHDLCTTTDASTGVIASDHFLGLVDNSFI